MRRVCELLYSFHSRVRVSRVRVRVRLMYRGVPSDGGISVYIPPPQNQSTLQIFMWLLVVFRYRASVRLSKISKVEIYTPK